MDDKETQPASGPQHTPGPWAWCGYGSVRNLYLMAHAPMRPVVMDFTRWGMTGAAPRFNVDGIMHRADELLDTIGHSKTIVGINHPDARLIAAAPDLLAACEAALTEMRAEGVAQLISPAMFRELKTAIAKARGQ